VFPFCVVAPMAASQIVANVSDAATTSAALVPGPVPSTNHRKANSSSIAVSAVAAIAAARATGLELRSDAIEFVPGGIAGGRHRVDVGTAGSVTLVMQALLPVMIAGGTPCTATIVGGTDVRAAPPLDYFGEVLLPLLGRNGRGCAACCPPARLLSAGRR